MKRYIKLDEWEKHFDKMMTGCPLPKKTIAKIKQMWIDGIPTADVVEVVRCKDCAYYDPWVCWLNGIETDDSWFCADGKRSE